MALFPAYGDEQLQPSSSSNCDEKWLKNTSFDIDFSKVTEPKLESEISGSRKKHKRKKTKTSKKIDTPSLLPQEPSNDYLFVLDTKRNKEFLSVKKIERPSAPRFFTKYYLKKKTRTNKKMKIKRYFQLINESIVSEKVNESSDLKEEKELQKMKEFYNRSLSEKPTDENMWLKFVNFQDVLHNFEKTYRKGSIAKGSRILAERKLTILDKALTHNPSSESLMRERLDIAASVYPADELQLFLKSLVEKNSQNIIVWQGYIESFQCSMSHCTTPSVLKIYTKCLSTLHQLRCNSTTEKTAIEESILRMLYKCGLFLKQTGLFEQLYVLIRLYLNLNLSSNDKEKFDFVISYNEKQLEDLEVAILDSQLPIHEIWLRIEKLRECCHWLPTKDENCEDPQRIVFTEDVVELIHPITTPGNLFKLTAIVMTLLKVPLLPCRHSTMQEFGLDYVPWALDSIEVLLPTFYPIYGVNVENEFLLKDTQKLAVGPQYLKTLPAQEEYLDFVLKIMRCCIDCLCGSEKMCLVVWWIRFQKLLLILDNNQRCKLTQNFKKKMRSSIKQFLKEESRDNVLYYQEYAMFEIDNSSKNSSLNILITTLSSQINDDSLINEQDLDKQKNICSLYRSIVETILSSESLNESKGQEALKHLVNMVLGRKRNSENVLTPEILNDTEIKFKHICLQLLKKVQKQETFEIIDHFLPNFTADWIICYGWFVYLTKGVINFGAFVQEIITELESEVNNNYSCWFREILHEFYVAVLLRYCTLFPGAITFKLIEDELLKSINSYPNNLFLLATLSKVQSLNCTLGQPMFQISKVLLSTGRAIPSIFLVLIAQQKISEMKERCIDTVSGDSFELDDIYKNKILSIFKRLTSPSLCTRRCGLVWRLYLQFLNSYFSPDSVRKAYFAAVEECPWLKALYIDAAIYIPAELSQIQDLIIEKQLRIHVTPEELEVLRS